MIQVKNMVKQTVLAETVLAEEELEMTAWGNGRTEVRPVGWTNACLSATGDAQPGGANNQIRLGNTGHVGDGTGTFNLADRIVECAWKAKAASACSRARGVTVEREDNNNVCYCNQNVQDVPGRLQRNMDTRYV